MSRYHASRTVVGAASDEHGKARFGFGEIVDLPFVEGPANDEKVKQFGKWLSENGDKYSPKYVRFYHATDPNLPILEEGLKPTSPSRRRSLQSQSGYVYLASTPERAKMFGDLGNQGNSVVYEVLVPVYKLLADLDQLRNMRSVGTQVGNSVAESIVHGGVRIRGKIDPSAIKLHSP